MFVSRNNSYRQVVLSIVLRKMARRCSRLEIEEEFNRLWLHLFTRPVAAFMAWLGVLLLWLRVRLAVAKKSTGNFCPGFRMQSRMDFIRLLLEKAPANIYKIYFDESKFYISLQKTGPYQSGLPESYSAASVMGLSDIFGEKIVADVPWSYLEDKGSSVEATHSNHRQLGVTGVEGDIVLDGGFHGLPGL